MSKIIIIAAVDSNLAIGYQNKLLFRLPNDLKHFKTLTTGKAIIMGRKTFESLPNGALPNRRNIVISSNPTFKYPQTEIFPTFELALESCSKEEYIYIIGGESIYRQALPMANELHLTKVNTEAGKADAFFPAIDFNIWYEKSREDHPADDKHLCSYSFINYIRR
ncbi:dihydrofolate reductase [uncultured Bacteroides sp.]|uniref:dihydrofolate reductase n=1 Tax=uncultured Bacteroides sp. TaxID=162156 RepID=UPI002AA93185|nr:dihydrofolate reductase [uncultured Bacteroides sp.]